MSTFFAAVRHKNGFTRVYRVEHAIDPQHARKVCLESLDNLHSVVVSCTALPDQPRKEDE